MHLYGTKPEALAEVAATIRTHGAKNPEAVFYGRRVTPARRARLAHGGRPVPPARLRDHLRGRRGLVLTTAERARDSASTPIYLLGGASIGRACPTSGRPSGTATASGRRAARLAFAQCGLRPADVDVGELYDPFSFEIIRQLEAMGFCKPGEGGDFVRTGASRSAASARRHQRRPALVQPPRAPRSCSRSRSRAVHQLRGELPEELTVPGAEVAITSNGGAGALFCDVLLLGKEPA